MRLGASPRAAHSRFVALVMERLASELGADAALWRIVGLVHDLAGLRDRNSAGCSCYGIIAATQ